MRYLSIDVGSKNMVFCRVENTDTRPFFRITHWLFVDCHGKTVTDIVAKFSIKVQTLDSSIFECDRVLIESQTARNVKMKVLSHCIQAVFIAKYGFEDIQFCSAHNKLKLCEEVVPSKSNYRQNKVVAIRKCTELMEDYKCYGEEGDKFYDLFINCPKKDDLADSLLQALFYIL